MTLDADILRRKLGEKRIEEDGLEEKREVETDEGSKRGVITRIDHAQQRIDISLDGSDENITRDVLEVEGVVPKSSYATP